MRQSPSRPVWPCALCDKGRQVRFVMGEIDTGQALNRGRPPTRRGSRAGEAEVSRAGSPGGDGDSGDQRAGRERGRQHRTPRCLLRGGRGSSAAPSQPPAAPASARDSSRTRAGEGRVAPGRGQKIARNGGRQHQPDQHGASAQGQKPAGPGHRQVGNRPPSRSRSPRRDHPQKHR